MLSARLQRDEAMGTNVGTTIRQPSTALLTIDSEDRFASYAARRAATYGSYNFSPYDFTITKNESIMNGFFTRLGVSEVVFPWAIPNINLQTNRIMFTWEPNLPPGPGSTVMLEVPVGFYKPSELAAKLKSLIEAIDPLLVGVEVTYGVPNVNNGDEIIPAFQFYLAASAGACVGYFRPCAYQPNPALPNYYPFQNTKQLFDVLGFTDAISPGTVYSSALNGNATLCQATRYVDIVCSLLTYNQSLKDTTTQLVARDSLCRLYLGALNSNMSVPPDDASFAPPGTTPGVIYTMYNNPKQIQWIPNQPVASGLQFQVYDDEGTLLNDLLPAPSIPGNPTIVSGDINWSITVLVSEN